MEKDNFITQLQDFLETKEITHDEAKEYLIDVFKKAFEKDRDALSRYEEEEPESANIKVDLNMEDGSIKIEKYLEVVEEKTIISRFRQIELGDERLENTDLKIGDVFVQNIDLNEINIGKRQHIKQLFLQKLSEVEKIKNYKKFSKYKGELLNATIHKVLDRGNVILDYEGDSIFMPSNEIPFQDKSKLIEGRPLTIYVLEVEELSKDAQIIASRRNPQFVAKLIEREIDDVSDGVVKIDAISREAGFKTKVAVSTTMPEVDPVGTIIGVKGQKIKPIINEIGGERLDVVLYHEDVKQFIAESLLPAEITGIKVTENEEGWREATVVVEQSQFLPALGKKGLNIKLAAIITRTKIDVKTVEEAREEGIEWESISKTKFVSKNNNDFVNNMNFDEFGSIEELAETESTNNFDYEDYEINDDFVVNDHYEEDEDVYDPEFEDEEYVK